MILDVVIVNYNVKYYLEQCLYAVRQSIAGLEAEVWVVDNNSKDGSVEYLKPLFPEVHFIENKENLGFSKANNLAIRASHGKYVLLLNPDTIVSSKSIRECIHLLDENPEIGSTGVSMYSADGTFARESRRAVPTPMVSFYKMSGLSALFPHHPRFARYHMGHLDPSEPSEIEIISGAYNMLRREALDKIGLLDEDFFMYGEDVDLSYRMLKGGWKNWYLPTPILHYKGESEHSSTVRYVNVFYQAMVIFYDKHFHNGFSPSRFLIRIAVYLKAFVALLIHFLRYLKSRLVKDNKRYQAYLYVNDEDVPAIKHVLQQENIDITQDVQKADFMLFQKSEYSYDEMLSMVIKQDDAHRLQLAVFDDERNVMILPRQIIEL